MRNAPGTSRGVNHILELAGPVGGRDVTPSETRIGTGTVPASSALGQPRTPARPEQRSPKITAPEANLVGHPSLALARLCSGVSRWPSKRGLS